VVSCASFCAGAAMMNTDLKFMLLLLLLLFMSEVCVVQTLDCVPHAQINYSPSGTTRSPLLIVAFC